MKSLTHHKTVITYFFFFVLLNLHSAEDLGSANDHLIQAVVCLLITIFLE